MISERKPLPETARRAGWRGCNILLGNIPKVAKIVVTYNGQPRKINDVVREYKKVYTLQTNSIEERSWLVDVLHYVEKLDNYFTLNQIYNFTQELSMKHPDNNHIQDKIRQQLQFLRNIRNDRIQRSENIQKNNVIMKDINLYQ